jgi:hypothetical protein
LSPQKKAQSFSGVGDIVIDPADIGENTGNLAQNSITAPSSLISAGANTQAATQLTAANVKKFLLDGLAWQAAKIVVKDITAQTVNWINSGFNGNPAFITDPAQFFTNQADLTVTNALNNIPGQNNLFNQICSVFQPNVRLALATQYLSQARLGQCSIQGLIKGYSGFINNFSNGGWEAWMSVTQNQQNNPYGTYIAAQDQLNLGIANNILKYKTQVSQGKGFLSWQSCSNTSAGSQASTIASNTSSIQACEAGGQSALVCATFANTTNVQNQTCTTQTPGSVIENQLEKQLGAPIAQLNLANSINQVVSALLTQGIKDIFGAAKNGLIGLSQTQTGQSAPLVNQLMSSSTQSVAEANVNYQALQANIPNSLAQAIDPNATSTSMLPTIDVAAVQAAAQGQADSVQAAYNAQYSSTNSGTTNTAQCGNGICEATETPTSCPQDCTKISTPTNPNQPSTQ